MYTQMAVSRPCLHRATTESSPWAMLPAFHFFSVLMASGLPQPLFQCVDVSLPLGIWTDPLTDLSSQIVLIENLQGGLIQPDLSPPWLWLQLARDKQCGATEKPKGMESGEAEAGLHMNWEAAGPTGSNLTQKHGGCNCSVEHRASLLSLQRLEPSVLKKHSQGRLL